MSTNRKMTAPALRGVEIEGGSIAQLDWRGGS